MGECCPLKTIEKRLIFVWYSDLERRYAKGESVSAMETARAQKSLEK